MTPIASRTVASAAVLLTLALALATGGTARADPPRCAATGNDVPFTLEATALRGATATDVYLAVGSSVSSCPAPDVLKKVQVKALAADGTATAVHNYFDVPAPGGSGILTPPEVERGQLLEIDALVQTPEAVRTHVLRRTATVRLRPDLVVDATAPTRVVRAQPFSVEVRVTEIGGDTGATAQVTLRERGNTLATETVTVRPGETATVGLSLVRLTTTQPESRELVATVAGAAPGELDVLNNSDSAGVAVALFDGDGIVSTENRQATEVGLDVLEAGGNAIDAAVAVQFALNAVEPENTGIGGGLTALVHLGNGGGDFAVDAREPATLAASPPNIFAGRTSANPLDTGGLGVGVPMTLRAVDELLERWGTWSLAQTLEPATRLAEDGMTVSAQLSRSACGARANRFPETAAIFRPGGVCVKPGDTLEQPDLAKTFELIAAQGTDVFYRGEIAPAIVDATRKSLHPINVGNMTLADLERAASDDLEADGRITDAISVDYRGRRVVSVPGSSAGGVVTLHWLKVIERFPYAAGDPEWGFQRPKAANAMIEAFRLAWSDRFFWLGDPRFTPVPFEGLLSSCYVDQRSALIDPDKRMPTPPGIRLPGNPLPCQGPSLAARGATVSDAVVAEEEPVLGQTSHFSIVDRWGNAVAFTTTVTDAFGTGITVPGYGFVLNDAMTNFNPNYTPAKNPSTGNPGANDVEPGKIPMGNTAPLMVFKDGEPVLVTGSPGGAFIPAVVFQVVTNMFDYGMDVQQAVDQPRIWANLTTVLRNPGIPADTVEYLRSLGHTWAANVSPFPQVGSAESIAIDTSTYALSGATDPRTAPDASFAVLAPS
jgi:gamma-glutamyltranspeptidase/glutathione hydrolase